MNSAYDDQIKGYHAIQREISIRDAHLSSVPLDDMLQVKLNYKIQFLEKAHVKISRLHTNHGLTSIAEFFAAFGSVQGETGIKTTETTQVWPTKIGIPSIHM